VALGVMLGAGFYTLTATKIYQSSASLVLDPQAAQPLGSKVESIDQTLSHLENREYYRTQQEILTSQRLALQVVKRLRLTFSSGFLKNDGSNSVSRVALATDSAAAETLISRLNVQFLRDSRILTVKVEDSDAKRAELILSTLVDLFIQQNLDTVVESSTAAADWLDGQLAKLKSDLQNGELSLHDYKINNNILSVSLDDQSNMLREEMTRLNALVTDARGKREELAARRTQIMKVSEENPLEVPATEMLANPVLSQERLAYVAALSERDALLKSGKGDNHPNVQGADARVAATRHALLSEIRNIKAAVSRDFDTIDQQVSGLTALLENSKKRALDLNMREIEYNRLNRGKENTEKLYSLVLERSKELDLTRMMRFNNIRVLDKPSLPENPVRPRVALNLAIGLLAGLGFGVAAAFARDRLDRSLKTLDDVEQALGIPAVGLLPTIGTAGRNGGVYGFAKTKGKPNGVSAELAGPPELHVQRFPLSGFAEAARAVRTNILFTSPDRPLQAILVTSPGPGEGKTTVACSVAITMAQAGQRVLLLDCDMRRPRIHRVFSRSNDLGLSLALLDIEHIDDHVYSTEVENLSILPSGPIVPNPAELLQTAAFARVLAALRERYDRIIIDSSPVAPVTDATVIATQVDGTLLVVRAFQTSRDLAQRASRGLATVGAHLLGVVLNDCDLTRHEYGYYQYYAYRKEGYGTQVQAPERGAA
jgi:capsular exopolysaccharide synthesis family protein